MNAIRYPFGTRYSARRNAMPWSVVPIDGDALNGPFSEMSSEVFEVVDPPEHPDRPSVAARRQANSAVGRTAARISRRSRIRPRRRNGYLNRSRIGSDAAALLRYV